MKTRYAISIRNKWAEDVNKSDILCWVEEELKKIPIERFGETRIELIISPRQYGAGGNKK